MIGREELEHLVTRGKMQQSKTIRKDVGWVKEVAQNGMSDGYTKSDGRLINGS